MSKDKQVRIFCDFGAEGIWNTGEKGLPISEGLRRRLEEWNWWFDIAYDHDANKRDMDIEEFSAVGLELAHAVKVELPDWTVIYLDEAAQDRAFLLQDRFGIEPPRCAWEYPITLGESAAVRSQINALERTFGQDPLGVGTPSPVQSWPGQRVAVVGCRAYQSGWQVRWYVRHLPPSVTVVTGCAPGVDSVAHEEAIACGLATRLVPGSVEDDALIRDDPDRLMAFWDGESRRTLMAILHARAAGIPVTLIDAVGKEIPYLQALIAAEETSVFTEWVEARERMGRPIAVDVKLPDLLKRLWDPFIAYRKAGVGKKWYGGPVASGQDGWYSFGWSEPQWCRPNGPFVSRDEALEDSRCAYLNIKYALPDCRRW